MEVGAGLAEGAVALGWENPAASSLSWAHSGCNPSVSPPNHFCLLLRKNTQNFEIRQKEDTFPSHTETLIGESKNHLAL